MDDWSCWVGMVDVSIKKTKIIFGFGVGESFVMEGIDGRDYIVYVPPRWSIPRDGGSYMNIQYVWNVEACVRWGEGGDDDGGMAGSFGECWESKEWKKSPCASFWLIGGNGEWAFFTSVRNGDLPMSTKEYVVWAMLGHLLRASKMLDCALQVPKH